MKTIEVIVKQPLDYYLSKAINNKMSEISEVELNIIRKQYDYEYNKISYTLKDKSWVSDIEYDYDILTPIFFTMRKDIDVLSRIERLGSLWMCFDKEKNVFYFKREECDAWEIRSLLDSFGQNNFCLYDEKFVRLYHIDYFSSPGCGFVFMIERGTNSFTCQPIGEDDGSIFPSTTSYIDYKKDGFTKLEKHYLCQMINDINTEEFKIDGQLIIKKIIEKKERMV